MRAVFGVDTSRSVRHFLLGSSADVLASLQARIGAEFPGARIVGAFSPPITDDVGVLADLSADAIKGSDAQLVWVGLGTPKQDWVSAALAEQLRVVVIPVGAAFDFMAGTTREAPGWLRGTGLEWLFRLVTEPRRLWRRYLVGNPVFIGGAIKSAWRARRPASG
jgi:N-acetylglucosaminyldiphosphoundecaprenol N-acetyl-beta-D-mannosaminyltransferase